MFAIRPASLDRLSYRLTWADAGVAVASSVLSPVIWSLGHAPMSQEALWRYISVAVVVSVSVMIFSGIGKIAVRFFSTCDAVSLLKVAALSVVIVSAMQFMVNRGDGIGRGLPAFHFFIFAFGLFVTRAIERRFARGGERAPGRVLKRQAVIVIGASRLAVSFIEAARHHDRLRVLAVLDDDDSLVGRSVAGCPVIGRPSSLASVIAEFKIHGVTVDNLFFGIDRGAFLPSEAREIDAVAQRFDCHILEQSEIFHTRPHEPCASTYTPQDEALAGEVRSRVIWGHKRLFDFVFASIFLIILSPLFLLCSLVVLFELGFPILFMQERLGQDGTPFNVLKFRTMRAGVAVPSVFGTYLRRTRLDELPQLFNILRGQMSLIGPRPLLASDQSDVPSVRLAALPGMTGWAQVCGANLCSLTEKIALDEWYVRHASFSLDARILFKTVLVVAFGEVRLESEIRAALSERAARLQVQALHPGQPLLARVDGLDASQRRNDERSLEAVFG